VLSPQILQAAVRETTIKSFVPTSHTHRPGFQLLSLVDPTEEKANSFADIPCHLPNHGAVLIRIYRPCAILTVLALLLFNWHRARNLPKVFLEDLSIPRKHMPPPAPSPLPPGGSVWSPYNPLPDQHSSPQNSLPITIRRPNPLSGPTKRIASRPSTPTRGLTPLTSPMLYHQEDELDDDPMYPAQYVTRRIATADDEDDWATNGPDGFPSASLSNRSFVAAGTGPHSKTKLFSFTFTLSGRRRRITLHVPMLSWTALKSLRGLLDTPDVTRRHGVLRYTLLDMLRVLWVVAGTWLCVTWWTC
jgi:ethanolamine phosphate phosphodiesterase